jgi:hypothetical protein
VCAVVAVSCCGANTLWQDADCSFLDAAELVDAGVNGPLTRLREATLFGMYNASMRFEWLRKSAGAQPFTRDRPAQLTDVDAEVWRLADSQHPGVVLVSCECDH